MDYLSKIVTMTVRDIRKIMKGNKKKKKENDTKPQLLCVDYISFTVEHDMVIIV